MGYAIVDDNGNVYGHDIQSVYEAACLLAEHRRKNPNARNIEIICQ